MDNRKRLPPQKAKVVENTSTAKAKKPDASEPKNATEPKDSKTVADPKKTVTDQKDKKTVTIVTDSKERKSVSEPKEKKTVTISDPKDKKPETKDKRMVTFVTEVKDKRIVTDTRENKIMSIEMKDKVPVVTEVKEKKSVLTAEPKEKVGPVVPVAPAAPVMPVVPVVPAAPAVPVVPEVKEILMPEVKKKKEAPSLLKVKGFKTLLIQDLKDKKAVSEIKEDAPVTEIKEQKVVPEVKEKKPVVEEKKDDGTGEVARTIVEGILAAAVQFVEDDRNPIKNIKWLTHGEFTAEKGRKEIEKFVSTWEFPNRWVYYADFIERKDLIHSFHYIYRVRWSAPTAVRPLARVSANAYFTIKFNKSKPPDMPVDVSYIFENSGLLQRPGKIRFREQWLRDITETKHILLESIPFKVV
ncbi:A-kinase anchor protein 14 [Arvicola amphibius]|uniref:A-kinase anchor protein 14 n=1 Tax=Arvicola amphibius TaxID=1047088 RepID=UPI0018E3A06A|nr:A-kinase anchor protein 14 [Arvicola amphibius]